jgi:hypothetical protein
LPSDRYSAEENALIVRCRETEHLTWDRIAKRLGRRVTGTAVRLRYEKIVEQRTPKPDAPKPTTRPCLGCQKLFLSAGKHNRLCDDCAGRDDSPFEPEEGGPGHRRVQATGIGDMYEVKPSDLRTYALPARRQR